MNKQNTPYHSTLHWAWRGPAQESSEAPITRRTVKNQRTECILLQSASGKLNLDITLTLSTAPVTKT